MNNYLFVVFISLLFFLSVKGQGQTELYFIGTGRGAVTAVETGPNEYKLREMPFSFNNENQSFRITFQDKFIYFSYGLVWDISGGKFSSGTPIILYPKKSSGNGNQQWRITPGYNKLASDIIPTMVANVSESGFLTLAQDTLSPPLHNYQRMYVLGFPFYTFYEIANKYDDTITMIVISPVGNWNTTIEKDVTYDQQFFGGFTSLTFLDKNGVVLSPSPCNLPNCGSYIRVPALGPLPDVPTFWNGYYAVNTTLNVSISFNISFNNLGTHNIIGTGFDNVFGAFNASGSNNNGQVSISTHFASSEYFYGYFSGYLDNALTTITGKYRSQFGDSVFAILSKN